MIEISSFRAGLEARPNDASNRQQASALTVSPVGAFIKNCAVPSVTNISNLMYAGTRCNQVWCSL